ncbi:MAG: (2Fe-2S) ferredoxin domain-containing protein [Candidatus Viridilinea halotolerans]|uniref:(2Fe-2S) ferredoxin domain-containing protein n=1 Tax=Candidatus Viridilinea halotolerans TaxID=2491704 RepID=A0A426U5R1_9CHLR|nr:MAG: (2Fe-2S) ferredoxin domain-containing protein [Candidatus Viridilinea halotolerans]
MGKGEVKVEHLARVGQPCVAICTAKHCKRAGAQQILGAAQAALLEAGLAAQVQVAETACQDHCDDGPVLTVIPGLYPYLSLNPATTRDVILQHVRDGQPLLEHLHRRFRRRLARRVAEEE